MRVLIDFDGTSADSINTDTRGGPQTSVSVDDVVCYYTNDNGNRLSCYRFATEQWVRSNQF